MRAHRNVIQYWNSLKFLIENNQTYNFKMLSWRYIIYDEYRMLGALVSALLIAPRKGKCDYMHNVYRVKVANIALELQDNCYRTTMPF